MSWGNLIPLRTTYHPALRLSYYTTIYGISAKYSCWRRYDQLPPEPLTQTHREGGGAGILPRAPQIKKRGGPMQLLPAFRTASSSDFFFFRFLAPDIYFHCIICTQSVKTWVELQYYTKTLWHTCSLIDQHSINVPLINWPRLQLRSLPLCSLSNPAPFHF